MQLTIKTLSQETFKVDLDPSSTVLNLKEKLKEMKNYDISCQKLMFAGKIMKDENTLESYNVTETGFIVVMVSQPKPATTPAEAVTAAPQVTEPSSTAPSASLPAESKQEQSAKPAASATADSSVELPPGTPTSTESAGSETQPNPQSQSEGGSALFNESTFLSSGPEIEETVENIKTMGFSEDMIRKALLLSYYNPDRAVEMLITNDPALSQQMPSPAAAQERPREPTPGVGLDGGATDRETPPTRPNTTGLPSNTLDYLSRTQQFQQIRNLIQSNPSFLEPLLVELQNTNPELFEQINENREEFFRLMTSNESEQNVEHAGGGGGGGGGESDASSGLEGLDPAVGGLPGVGQPGEGTGRRVLTVTLTPEEQAKIDTIINWSGVSRQQAVEVFLLCDRNAELAINYIMDNQNDL